VNNKGFTLIELLIVMAIVCMIIPCIGISIYGLVLAFKASILLGIIAFIVEPSPFVFGICGLFGKNLPEAIQAWANLPF
jgi:prepilin-type N-terminal cleavage/methylation domain-containing protein